MFKKNYLILLGTVIEAYDTFIFILLFPIFSPLFFNKSEPQFQLLLATCTFLFSYFGRPIGALLFGHFGDRFGRCIALSVSIILISTTNILIAFLPTYSSIGITAPGLLILYRIVQGICYGGEVSGAGVYIVENADEKVLNKSASLTNLAVLIGGIIAKVVAFLIFQQSENTYLWRFTFFMSACFGIIGYYLRKGLYENNNEPKIKSLSVRWPILLLAQEYKLNFIVVVILSTLILLPFLSAFYYIPHTISTISQPIEDILLMSISIPVLLVMTFCADRFGMYRILFISFFIFIGLILPLIYYISINNDRNMLFFIKLSLFFMWSLNVGPINIIGINLFPRNIRYTAVSFSCACGVLLSSILAIFMWTSATLYLKYIPIFIIITGYCLSFYILDKKRSITREELARF